MRYRLAAVPKTAIIVVLGVLVSGGQLNSQDLLVASLCCLLWIGLYGLNEAIDLALEEKKRVNRWVVPLCLGISMLAITGGLLAGGWQISILMTLMAFSQLVYCWPRPRTKRFVWSGPLQSGVLNPTLRFSAGLILGWNPTTNPKIVLACYTLLIALHFAGALKTRVYQTKRDRGLGYQTFPVAFVIRYIEPLQLLTPFCVSGLVLLAYRLQDAVSLPTSVRVMMVLGTTTGILVIWALNDVYDRARHRLRDLLLQNYDGNLAQAELQAASTIARLEVEAGTPSMKPLRDLWHFKVPANTITPEQLALVAPLSLIFSVLPLTIAPITTAATLIAYRTITRPH